MAPPGLKHVQTMSCGSCSVEHAQKAMFMAYKVYKVSDFLLSIVF